MQALGLDCTEEGSLGSQPMQGYPGLNARWAFYGSHRERSPILLLQPLSSEGPIHDFLRTRAAGAQHLAFAVEDLDEAYALLSRSGVHSRGQIRSSIPMGTGPTSSPWQAFPTCCSS
jgi:hypothetical protein